MNDALKPPTHSAVGTALNPTPPKRSYGWLWLLIAALLIVGLVLFYRHMHPAADASAAGGGGRRAAAGAGGPPVMVSTATAKTGDIGVYITALGTVTPVYTVAVQSRIAGQIMKVNYTEGQLVHTGDSLIEIDSGPYQAAVAQAQGQLTRDTALLADAKLDLERYHEAFASNAIPQQQYETQVATVKSDEGTVQLDQGNLDSAKVQLAYCHITAPITGRVGLRLVDPGNIAQVNGSNLVVITQLQPITVIFNVSEDNLPQIQAALKAGGPLVADVFDRTQQKMLATGTLQTLDNQIDTATGTLKLRAIFTNDDEALFPNQFVNVRLTVDTHEDVILLPNSAIQLNDAGAFVYLISTNQTGTNVIAGTGTNAVASTGASAGTNQVATVALQTVTVGTTDGTVSEITDGLDEGQVVAADNFNRLTDGAKVILRPANGKGGKGGHKKSAQAQQ